MELWCSGPLNSQICRYVLGLGLIGLTSIGAMFFLWTLVYLMGPNEEYLGFMTNALKLVVTILMK